ncbi:MAG TPA: hypothetical protein VE975_07825 [Actinomycetota bacterium]|jgi:CO dehydrogenase maturation factor|nr:hypothetical protein [Actinomycetota bacterium]
MCSSHATVRGLLHELDANQDLVVVDTEASPEHLSRSTTEAVDVMLVVGEPYFKSLETARRYSGFGRDLGIPRVAMIANKVRDDNDRQVIDEFCRLHDMELFGVVPQDRGLVEAERLGVAPVDHDASGAGVTSIGDIAHKVLQLKATA